MGSASTRANRLPVRRVSVAPIEEEVCAYRTQAAFAEREPHCVPGGRGAGDSGGDSQGHQLAFTITTMGNCASESMATCWLPACTYKPVEEPPSRLRAMLME